MTTMLMWCYASKSLLPEIKRAVKRFEQKYGRIANTLWLRPEHVTGNESIEGLEIRANNSMTKCHFGLSRERNAKNQTT